MVLNTIFSKGEKMKLITKEIEKKLRARGLETLSLGSSYLRPLVQLHGL